MKKFFLGLSLVFVFNAVFSATSPVVMLEARAQNILQTLEANKASLKTNPSIIYKAISKNLLPIVDAQGMARSVLGRTTWGKASASERSAFINEFTQLVIRTYAAPLTNYSGETIKFFPVRGGITKKFIKVNSLIIRPNGQKIPVAYSLIAKNSAWKVYDLSVEGVSLLQSFKSQFSQILKNSNMTVLLKELKKQNLGKRA